MSIETIRTQIADAGKRRAVIAEQIAEREKTRAGLLAEIEQASARRDEATRTAQDVFTREALDQAKPDEAAKARADLDEAENAVEAAQRVLRDVRALDLTLTGLRAALADLDALMSQLRTQEQAAVRRELDSLTEDVAREYVAAADELAARYANLVGLSMLQLEARTDLPMLTKGTSFDLKIPGFNTPPAEGSGAGYITVSGEKYRNSFMPAKEAMRARLLARGIDIRTV